MTIKMTILTVLMATVLQIVRVPDEEEPVVQISLSSVVMGWMTTKTATLTVEIVIVLMPETVRREVKIAVTQKMTTETDWSIVWTVRVRHFVVPTM